MDRIGTIACARNTITAAMSRLFLDKDESLLCDHLSL